MVKRATIGVVLACFWPVRVSLAQENRTLVLSLAQCEALALKNHPLVKDANANLELSRARKAQASHARFLPQFTLRDIWGPVPRARGEFTPTGVLVSPDTSTGLSDLRPFMELELNLLQPIWTFGKLSGLNEAASFGVDAREADVRARENDVRLKVRELYWGLVLGRELLEVVEDALEEVTKAEGKLQEKLDEGSEEVSQNDLFKLQVFKYDILKRHRAALDKLEVGRAALRAAIGLDETIDFDVETKELIPLEVTLDSVQVYIKIAMDDRPDIAQLRAAMSARRSQVGVARSDYLPQFFLAGQVKYNRAADRFDPRNPFVYNPTNFFRPGFVLGLNWNLNFVQTGDEVRMAEAEFSKLAQQEAPLLEGIRLEVRKAYLEFKQAEQNVMESRDALKASDNWFRAAAQTFDIGIGEVKDFIDAFTANATMRAEHLQTLFEFNTSLARLSKAVGRDLYPH